MSRLFFLKPVSLNLYHVTTVLSSLSAIEQLLSRAWRWSSHLNQFNSCSQPHRPANCIVGYRTARNAGTARGASSFLDKLQYIMREKGQLVVAFLFSRPFESGQYVDKDKRESQRSEYQVVIIILRTTFLQLRIGDATFLSVEPVHGDAQVI